MPAAVMQAAAVVDDRLNKRGVLMLSLPLVGVPILDFYGLMRDMWAILPFIVRALGVVIVMTVVFFSVIDMIRD